MEENDDPYFAYMLLICIVAMVAWLLYKHTGVGKGQIDPVYWAGVATPLLSQIARKVFNLRKKTNGT